MANYKLADADQLDADLETVANAIRTKGGTFEKLSFPAGMAEAIGVISTGVELNFDVVDGTSAPTNPKENTIWVNTDTEITGWIFSAAEPETLVEGNVWIRTGTSGAFEFNALKKNCLQVYPLSAKQYENGTLTDKPVLCYQGGKWADGYAYIVKNGVIGDLGLSGIARPASITVTEQDGFVSIVETDGKSSGITTPDKVKVDEFSRLNATIDLKAYGTTSSTDKLDGVSIALLSSLDNSSVADLVAAIVCQTKTTILGKQTLDLDISNVSGDYYVGFVFASSSSTGKPNMDVFNFYLA